MSTKTRTREDIHAEILEIELAIRCVRAVPDTADYWRAAAEGKERCRELWQQIGDHCGADVPDWARSAAFSASYLCSDQAHTYRRFAREIDAR
jgi:hypothetical protein